MSQPRGYGLQDFGIKVIRFHDRNSIRVDAGIRQEILEEIMYSIRHQGRRCQVENTYLLPSVGRVWENVSTKEGLVLCRVHRWIVSSRE